MYSRVETKRHKSGNWTQVISGGAPGVTYIVPEPEPEGARIWFFTRRGGVSELPFDSLNVSTKVGDQEVKVVENLSRIKKVMNELPLAWTRLIAGDDIVRVTEAGLMGEADALVTNRKNLPLTIAAADCAPVVLVGECDVGMAHSGWRGALAGIAGKTVLEMEDTDVRAYIGPVIRECCYEVSEELAAKFAQRFGPEVVSGRYLSLPKAIRKNLKEAGVEEVHDLGLCTGCRPDLFFSHRMQGPYTGRNLAAVARS